MTHTTARGSRGTRRLSASLRATTHPRTLGAAARMLALATLALGILYPLSGVAVGTLMPGRAEGSLVEVNGVTIGSALIGQAVDGDAWFHGRPSAAAHDALASGASNAGPNSPDLVAEIENRRAEVAAREGVDAASVPADAVTGSASGLDPHISPAYAALQVERVARERGLAATEVRALVAEATTPDSWLALGDATVNVVELNAALAARG
jgi:K+-transporting ATPase ATPase C chain